MFSVKPFATTRLEAVRAREEHLAAIEQVFADNASLLAETGCTMTPADLARDTVFNRSLPPNWGALWFWARLGYTQIGGVHGSPSPPGGMVELRKRL